jgi:hypothetical protein
MCSLSDLRFSFCALASAQNEQQQKMRYRSAEG